MSPETSIMRQAIAFLGLIATGSLLLGSGALADSGQPAPAPGSAARPPGTSPTSGPYVKPTVPTPPPSEAEYLVPPQGAAMEVPLHVGKVCILSFPEHLAKNAISSSSPDDYDIHPWGTDEMAVRAGDKARDATLAIATMSGDVKVNVTFRVVPKSEPALTLVRFKAATAAEAFETQVTAEVRKRLHPMERALNAKSRALDTLVAQRADAVLVERLLQRSEVVPLDTHARNDENVIVHVRRALLLGNEGYLVFDVQNRSRAVYRLARVRVFSDGRDVGGEARLVSSLATRDPAVIGLVAAGATARGVVAIRAVNSLLRRPLALELLTPTGTSTIRADRGVVLK